MKYMYFFQQPRLDQDSIIIPNYGCLGLIHCSFRVIHHLKITRLYDRLFPTHTQSPLTASPVLSNPTLPTR
jgi:hypothetical protein